ncbi:hypothetical protein GUJ93_ZPchr0013g35802 [Zizania palustris]|uniref:Uncharacterized protein n=1 Tax=Zizania palustris TaxID=103762 RepID=A0A8J5X223_ZIZPA|nr:hypothetical protein GUJ93_ZPchr0013g35802 [Zizania palustris]
MTSGYAFACQKSAITITMPFNRGKQEEKPIGELARKMVASVAATGPSPSARQQEFPNTANSVCSTSRLMVPLR